MAMLTALALRARAREAMLLSGGRGFMRFADGGALLVTDAPRHGAHEEAAGRIASALEARGFVCRVTDGLMEITPGRALLENLEAGVCTPVDWESPLAPAQALGARWSREKKRPLTPEGQALVVQTLRLLWQPEDRVLAGLSALRGQAAVMLRKGDRSGMAQAGGLLGEWCRQEGIACQTGHRSSGMPSRTGDTA